jgi:hypothetical protein
MRKLTTLAIATATFALITSASNAEYLGGAPVKNGGNCWNSQAGGHSGMGWGYWAPCPNAAAGQRTALLRHPLRARRDPHNDR